MPTSTLPTGPITAGIAHTGTIAAGWGLGLSIVSITFIPLTSTLSTAMADFMVVIVETPRTPPT